MINNFQPQLFHDLSEKQGREFQRLWRRASMQIEFARAFAGIQGQGGQESASKIDAAEHMIEGYKVEDGLDGFASALNAAEEAMAHIGVAAKKYRIHNIGHGHIDMNWQWSWQETVAITHDTFASVLDLMRRYPDFTYSQSQTSVYALVERYHPAMFGEIRQRVREGRWEITASQWVEGEKNCAAGESLCRHLQMTRAYFQEKFGLTPEDVPIDWEPDTFGHPITLPGILAQGAVKYYYCCRAGGGFELARVGDARPLMFYWQSADGARVLVNREVTWYNGAPDTGENVALALVDFARETGLHDWMNVYGVGNHGGGPTRAAIDYLHELAEWPIYPAIEFGTVKRYFETVDAELSTGQISLPVLEHELNFEVTGCYTSQSLIKQANRFGENYLIEAQALAAISSRTTDALWPKALLDDGWSRVLFSQFHDILPGSGVRQTREYAMGQFQEVGAITGAIKREAIKALTAKIDTASMLPDSWAGREELSDISLGASSAGHGVGAASTGLSDTGGYGNRFRPYVVFNPCAWERSERIVVSIYDSGFDRSQIVAVAEDGSAQPVLGLSDNPNNGGHARLQVAFDANNIPAMGYRTYLLCDKRNLGDAAGSIDKQSAVMAEDPNRFETPYLKFRVDREMGGVTGLVDKRTGARIMPEHCKSPLGTLQYVVEETHGMEAWVLGGEVAEPVNLKNSGFYVQGRSIRNTGSMDGPLPAGCQANHVLVVPGTSSTVTLMQSIAATQPRLDFTADVNWREIGSPAAGMPGLVMTIPLGLTSITARYETPFGSIERQLFDGEEVPSLRYAHIEGTARTESGEEVFAGVTLVQDCKYGHSITGNDKDGYVLKLRIVRSSFSPDPMPEVAIAQVRYSIHVHDRPADPAALARLGAEWNHPLIATPVSVQNGEWPVTQGFVRVLTSGVVVTALKIAEQGSGVILRMCELNGVDTEAEVDFAPNFARGLTKVRLVDIMERPVNGRVEWSGNRLVVSVAANHFVTVKID